MSVIHDIPRQVITYIWLWVYESILSENWLNHEINWSFGEKLKMYPKKAKT